MIFAVVRSQFRLFSGFQGAKPLIVAGCILQRNPITLLPLTAFESEYKKYQEEIQLEKSRGIFNLKSAVEKIEQEFPSASSAAATGLNSAKSSLMEQEMNQLQEQTTKEYAPFENDRRSLKRALDRILYLAVAESAASSGGKVWKFPAVPFDKQVDSALDIAASNAVSQLGKMTIYSVGKAPIAFFKEKFPEQEEVSFFFRAQILSGGVGDGEEGETPLEKYADYAWLTKEELESCFSAEYFASVRDVLSK